MSVGAPYTGYPNTGMMAYRPSSGSYPMPYTVPVVPLPAVVSPWGTSPFGQVAYSQVSSPVLSPLVWPQAHPSVPLRPAPKSWPPVVGYPYTYLPNRFNMVGNQRSGVGGAPSGSPQTQHVISQQAKPPVSPVIYNQISPNYYPPNRYPYQQQGQLPAGRYPNQQYGQPQGQQRSANGQSLVGYPSNLSGQNRSAANGQSQGQVPSKAQQNMPAAQQQTNQPIGQTNGGTNTGQPPSSTANATVVQGNPNPNANKPAQNNGNGNPPAGASSLSQKGGEASGPDDLPMPTSSYPLTKAMVERWNGILKGPSSHPQRPMVAREIAEFLLAHPEVTLEGRPREIMTKLVVDVLSTGLAGEDAHFDDPVERDLVLIALRDGGFYNIPPEIIQVVERLSNNSLGLIGIERNVASEVLARHNNNQDLPASALLTAYESRWPAWKSNEPVPTKPDKKPSTMLPSTPKPAFQQLA